MSSAGSFAERPCPAKINLTLAILGRRADGFHDLHSVVAQTDFGDRLRLEWNPDARPAGDRIETAGLAIDGGATSVATALRLFREATGTVGGRFTARLLKRIPVGAGLGGGSSDATAALLAARQLAAPQRPDIDWTALAARAGSDCPLFLDGAPVIMEGRGERISPLPEELARRLAGLPVLLFKPDFGINTAEAYRRLAQLQLYQPPEAVSGLIERWQQSGLALPPPLNDFERLLGQWLPSLAVVLDRLRRVHGLDARLSGSGSAAFVIAPDLAHARKILKEEGTLAWDNHFWMQEAKLK